MSELKYFVVMGVAGCGKTTVASLLAKRFGATMIEADELHGDANIAKMVRGEALKDADRWPWLRRVADAMKAAPTPTFVSCSALRRDYRDYLLNNTGVAIGFIHLHATFDVIAERMAGRDGHFMPLSLLESQFQLLEHLANDEAGVVVDISQAIETVVNDAMRFVNQG